MSLLVHLVMQRNGSLQIIILPLTTPCLWGSTGNGLGIRVVGGKEVPGSDGEIGAYVAKVLPGGAAEQTGKILEGKSQFSLSW